MDRVAHADHGKVRSRLAMSLILCAVVCGCGASSGHPAKDPQNRTSVPYPQPTEQSFMVSCVREATLHVRHAVATTYCADALACIEQHLSFVRYERYESNLYLGRPNPDARVLVDCVQSVRSHVLGRA